LSGIVHRGPGWGNPAISDAGTLSGQRFGVQDGDPSRRRRAALLDAVLEDAGSLRGRLGAADQQRLDEHLEHLYEVQGRLDPIAATCEVPSYPGDPIGFTEDTGVMADMLAIALGCGMTRSFSFMLTAPGSTHVFSDVGVREGHHKNCHDGAWEDVVAGTLQQMRAFAQVARAFESHKDAAGNTILDRMLLYGTSEYGEGWNHGVAELPVVLVGGAAGGLERGVHVREAGGNLARAQLTALQALGLPFENFGFNGAETRESFTELLR